MLRASLLSLCLLAGAPLVGAQRPERVPAGVRMTQARLEVRIVEGVASTTIHQTWRNDGGGEAEAVWILPLPEGAVADGFTMTMNGVATAGDVLDADQARGVYEGIVRSRRDPGLLEYFGRGCLRARIFPIPAQGEVQVVVGYRQVLPERLGLREWSFPLAASGAGGMAPELLVLDLALASKRPIKNAWSPLPTLQVLQKSDHEVRASFEGSPALLGGKELALYHSLSEKEFGLDLLAHRGAGEEQGTFLMLVSPKREWQEQETLKKSIVFVLDTSGSMEGEKFAQARASLHLFLDSLSPEDQFDVVPFATEAEPFFASRVPATPERIGEAKARVDKLVAAGGTNIEGALTKALASQVADGRVPIVVFLTDGEPTVGMTNKDDILASVKRGNTGGSRVFVLGVGAKLDTHLLDRLAQDHGGARDYVRSAERIDDKVRALFAKLSHPVMTGLELTVDGLATTQVTPARLPDLFAGDRLEILGRYAGDGARAIRLRGVVNGAPREYVYEASFPRESGGEASFVPALWAERRVAGLLDAIRLNGPNAELVNEVERLGREYRIVTPYTSHLVVEPGLRVGGLHRGPGDTVPSGRGGPGSVGPASGAAGPGTPGVAGPGSPGLRGPGSRPTTGGGAQTGSEGWFLGSSERKSEDDLGLLADELARAGVLPKDAPREELVELALNVARELRESEARLETLGQSKSGDRAVDDSVYLAGLMRGRSGGGSTLLELFTRRVQDRTFVLREGKWFDQSLVGAQPTERRVIEAFSPAYFQLLKEQPKLAPFLALSPRLVLRAGDEVLEIREPASEPVK